QGAVDEQKERGSGGDEVVRVRRIDLHLALTGLPKAEEAKPRAATTQSPARGFASFSVSAFSQPGRSPSRYLRLPPPRRPLSAPSRRRPARAVPVPAPAARWAAGA